MNAELATFCHRLLGALATGAYQGLLVTGAVGTAMLPLRRANAATRHLVWMIALLLVATLPLAHWLIDEEQPGTPGFAPRFQSTIASNPPNARGTPELSETGERDLPFTLPTQSASDSESQHPRAPISAAANQSGAAPEQIGAEPAQSETWRWTSAIAALQGATELLKAWFSWPPLRWSLPFSNNVAATLVLTWLVLALARLGHLGRQFYLLDLLKKRGQPAPETLDLLFNNLRAAMCPRRKAKLLVCDGGGAPIAIGFFNPAVIIPAALLDTAGELEWERMFRHELAHLVRRDDWANLLQQTIRCVLFFHPAVWWISRRLAIEREIACDDHVLAATRDSRAYALFLTDFAGRMQCRNVAAASAAWSNRHQLKERITMILDSNRNSSPRVAGARVGVLAIAAALIALLGLAAGPRLAFAQDKADSFSPTVESGPRPKPEPQPEGLTPPPAPPVEPVAAESAVIFKSSAAAPSVAIVQPAQPFATPPAKPMPPSARNRRGSDSSIERRLDRLEELVDSLVAREKGKPRPPEQEFKFNYDKFGKKPSVPNQEDITRMQEMAKRETDRAMREVDRAMKQMEQTLRESQPKIEGKLAPNDQPGVIDHRAIFKTQRQALEVQRKALEKQLAAIERQMERLEAEQQKLDEKRADYEKRHSDSDQDEPKAKAKR